MENKQTILIIDENEVNLDILILLLDQYNIIPAKNAKSAFHILETEKIDLILMEVNISNINGFEICKTLKFNDKTKHIPIIFLTSKNGVEDVKKGFDLGAVDYITKPFSPVELSSRVTTHLQLKSYQESLEEKVRIEVEKNKLQEQIMFQNSKQAEIGELLMHIAHQWKQPLSELGSINLLNTLYMSNDTINKDELSHNFDRASMILDFMSQTVETFQDFYKPTKINTFFDILSTIEKSINMVNATFDYENITININKTANPTIFANQNEYEQVILSILNNAKDIFTLRKVKNKVVTISITSKNDKSIVTIEDNAGGITLANKNDIFLPNVSEKGSTGIGLYMSKNILKKNNGTLNVENTKKGAKFTIVL